MRKNHNSLKTGRKRKTLRDTYLSCDTNKFESMKERLCLKCGEKLLGECPYNHICENCSLINERIALKTFAVSSKSLGEEDPLSRSPSPSFSVMQGSRVYR